jgi:hypothetical protein
VGLPGSYVLCGAILALVGFLGSREVALYRSRHADESDLFVYTRSRVVIRALGLTALLAFAFTLALMEARPPRSPEAAAIFMGAFALELLALILSPILDMLETRRSARVHEHPSLSRASREARR